MSRGNDLPYGQSAPRNRRRRAYRARCRNLRRSHYTTPSAGTTVYSTSNYARTFHSQSFFTDNYCHRITGGYCLHS